MRNNEPHEAAECLDCQLFKLLDLRDTALEVAALRVEGLLPYRTETDATKRGS